MSDLPAPILALALFALAGCGDTANLSVAQSTALLVADDVGNAVWRVSAER